MGREGRYSALLLAACMCVALAMPAQAAAPGVAKPQAAPIAAPAAVRPPAPSPSNHRPLPTSSKVRSPEVQNPKLSGNPLFGISCPATDTCYAVGFGWQIEKTVNAGATWTPQGSVEFLNGIACVSATSCVAVGDGGVIRYTTNGGTTWQQGASPLNTNWLSGVSCVANACWLVGQAGLIYHSVDSGATWSAQTSGTTNDLWGVSCSTATQCTAVGVGGTILRTTDGTSWLPQFSGTPNLLYGVSCPSGFCVAVGLNGASPVIFDGGWTGSVPGTGTTLTAVSCPVETRCWATGVDGAVYRMDGSTVDGLVWVRTSTFETGALYSVSCQTVTACSAAGDYGMVETTTNGGSGWAKQSPNLFGLIRSVSCPTTSTCFAVGRDRLVLATADGGATWSSYQNSWALVNSTTFWGISCPSATVCFVATGNNRGVADGSGTILATTDGGANWGRQSTPGVTGTFMAVSCPDTTHCFAVTSSGELFATSDGTTWASQTSPVAGQPLSALSCPTTLVCYAAGSPSTSIGTTDGGANWNAQGAIGTFAEPIYSMSCPSTTTCFAGGQNNIHVTTDSGATWTDATATGGRYSGISCFSTTVCTATSGDGVEYTADGSTWTVKATPATGGALLGIACPSATVCVAGGQYSGNQLDGIIVGTTDANASWQLLTESSTRLDFAGISCSSPTVCHAIVGGLLNNTWESDILSTANNGTQWFNQYRDVYSQFQAISCPSDTVCFVVGSTSGYPGSTIFRTTDGGANWNAQIAASGASAGFDSISCLNTNACFAAGYDGSIVKTIDAGTSWHAMPPVAGAASVSAISCLNSTVCFATDATAAGHVYTTQDGGASWTLSWDAATDPFTSSAGPLYGISCFGAQTCIAVGRSGLIGITTDDGAHWRAGDAGTTTTLTSISCLSVCFATTGDGLLLFSADNGSTWFAQAPAPHGVYTGVSCADSQACFAVGWAGAISETKVGGQAWTTVNPPASQSTATPTTTAIASSSNPTSVGSSVTYSAAAVPTPDGGTVAFTDNATTLSGCAAVAVSTSTGKASCTTSYSAVGSHAILASYSGDTNYAASSRSLTQQVNASTGSAYTAQSPNRILDTRLSHQTLGAGGSLNLTVAGGSTGVPASAIGVVLNVTVTNTSASSLLTVWPAGQARPATSNLNWLVGETRPNLVNVPVGANSKVSIYNAKGSADVVVDEEGYFAAAVGTAGGYNALSPARLLDTRLSHLTMNTGSLIDLQILGAGGVPATGVSAVVLNATATNTASAGLLTLYPSGTTRPTASNVNWAKGWTIANRVIVKVGTNGKVSIYNAKGSADVVVDVNGYFTDATASGKFFTPLSPVRILDTRLSSGTLGPKGTYPNFQVTGNNGVPSGTTAVFLNTTVTNTTASSALTVYPNARPTASDLNWRKGQIIPNSTLATLSSSGTTNFYNADGSTDLVLDLSGYFGP
jgi:photosystem II stability/assembly factor-like uncharacterized protein